MIDPDRLTKGLGWGLAAVCAALALAFLAGLLAGCSSTEQATVTVEEPSAVVPHPPDTTRLAAAPPADLEGTPTQALALTTYETPDTTSTTADVRRVTATDSTVTVETPRRATTYRLPALGETLRLLPDTGGWTGRVEGTQQPRTTEVDVPQSEGWSARTWLLVGGGFVLGSLGLIALIKIL